MPRRESDPTTMLGYALIYIIFCLLALAAGAAYETYQHFKHPILCCANEQRHDANASMLRLWGRKRDPANKCEEIWGAGNCPEAPMLYPGRDGYDLGNAQKNRSKDNLTDCLARHGKPMMVPLRDADGKILIVYEGCL